MLVAEEKTPRWWVDKRFALFQLKSPGAISVEAKISPREDKGQMMLKIKFYRI